jgi:hypothetical protein
MLSLIAALRCCMLHGYVMCLLLRRDIILVLLVPRGFLHGIVLLMHQLSVYHLLLQMWWQASHLPARLHGCDLLLVEASWLTLWMHTHLSLPCHLLSLPQHPLLLLVQIHDMRIHALRWHSLLMHHLSSIGSKMRHGVRTWATWHLHARLHAHHGRLRYLLSMWS